MHLGDEWIPSLEGLYHRIDATYAALAGRIGFSCKGCDGAKCCTVDLMLHTFAEQLYLRRGSRASEPSSQAEISRRCKALLDAKQDSPHGDAYRNAVCVLNSGGLCQLYEYRPMICRLAGIPHVFTRPDGKRVLGEGCPRFRTAIEPLWPDVLLDRSELYRDMASIEIEFVRSAGKRAPSLTVAETLMWEDGSESEFRPNPSA